MLVYEVASRKINIGKDKGVVKYYAKPDKPKVLSRQGLEDQIVSKTMMSRGDVRNAITTLAETIEWALSEGLSVDLADLGAFKVEAHSRYVATEDAVHASILKTPRIRFFPKQRMLQAAKAVSLAVRTKRGVEVQGGAPGGSPTPSPSPGGSTPGGL